jgi:hypothetical protein
VYFHDKGLLCLRLTFKYYWSVQFEELEMGVYVAHMRETKNACRILVGKPQGKKPWGRLGALGR